MLVARKRLVVLGVVFGAVACGGGGTPPPPPLLGMAPPSGDIVSPTLFNRALYDEAVQKNLTAGEIERAGRSVELAFRMPLVLSTFNPFVVDDDITISDSRFPGEERSILEYLEPGLPGTSNAAFGFSRTVFAREQGEGDCAFDSADKSCDTVVLYFREGAVPDGATIQLNVSGDGLEGYEVVDGARTDTLITLGGLSVVGFDVRAETGDAPELQSYSLRLPADSGPDIEGELELGVCTTCPPPSTLFFLPQREFYVPVRAPIRGRFNESPARIGMFVEYGDEMAFLTAADLTGTEGPFRPGVDTEFEVIGVPKPGFKVDTLAITSDDLLTQLGTPARFSLPPATQSASGREFVQRVGTTGTLPASDIQHFTFSHVRIPTPAEGGFADHEVYGIADLAATSQIQLPIDVVVDADNPSRTVTDLEVLIRDAADPRAARTPIRSVDEFLDPARPTVTFDLRDIPEGDWRLYVRGRNGDGGNLGSDRVQLTVDLTSPAIVSEASSLVDNWLTDGKLDRVCVASNEVLSAVELTVDPPGIAFRVALDGVPPTQENNLLVYCVEDVVLPPGVGDDGEPYVVTIAPIDRAGNAGVGVVVPVTVELATRELTAQLNAIKGTGLQYWDMSQLLRERFDLLVRARAARRSQSPAGDRFPPRAGAFPGDSAKSPPIP